MKSSKKCWGSVLIAVNIAIALLALLQMGVAVEFQNTINSSNVLKYKRKWEIILFITTGLMSFLVAIYGIFVVVLYITSFVVAYACVLLFSIVVQVPVCIVAFYNFKNVDQKLFQDPKTFIRNNKPSQGLIFLQNHLRCCGFEGMNEYTELPISCCENTHECKRDTIDIYRMGCRAAMENYFEIYGSVIAIILLHHIAVDIVGIIGAFYQRKHIKKELEQKRKVSLRNSEGRRATFDRPDDDKYSTPRTKSFLFKEWRKRTDENKVKDIKDEEGQRSIDVRNKLSYTKRNESKNSQYNPLDKVPSEEWVDDLLQDIRTKEDTKSLKNSRNLRPSFASHASDNITTVDVTQIDPTAVLGTCESNQTTVREENTKRRCIRKTRTSKIKERVQSETENIEHSRKRSVNATEEKNSTPSQLGQRIESAKPSLKGKKQYSLENEKPYETLPERSSSPSSRKQLRYSHVEKVKSRPDNSPQMSSKKSVISNQTKEEVSHKGSVQRSLSNADELRSIKRGNHTEKNMSGRSPPRTSFDTSTRSSRKSYSPNLKSPATSGSSPTPPASGGRPSRPSEYRPFVTSVEQLGSSLDKQPPVRSGNSLLRLFASKDVEKSGKLNVEVQSTSYRESVRKSNRDSPITHTSIDGTKSIANKGTKNVSERVSNSNPVKSRNASVDHRASVETSPRSKVDWPSTRNAGSVSAGVGKANRAKENHDLPNQERESEENRRNAIPDVFIQHGK